MTGYGAAFAETDEYSVAVEVKSLNSKFLDLNCRLPKILNEKELEIRNKISEVLIRGKVSLNIEIEEKSENTSSNKYHQPAFKKLYHEIKQLAATVNDPADNVLKIVLQHPDVINNSNIVTVPIALWNLVQSTLVSAIEKCDQYRLTEGAELGKVMLESKHAIETGLEGIKELDKGRGIKIRERILSNLEKLNLEDDGLDKNRFEQEIIYYLEKLDINEEIDRLNAHLKYFTEILKEKAFNGKKLGFLGQELGREINTIGSKANDADMQRIVVGMKEELEKIKEQVLNIL